jgi:hypothetical protein
MARLFNLTNSILKVDCGWDTHNLLFFIRSIKKNSADAQSIFIDSTNREEIL